MGWLEGVGVAASAVSVLLAVLQRPATYPVGIVGCLVYGWLFSSGGLYAQAGLQVVYLGLGVLGWFWWVRGGPGGSRLPVRRTPRWVWPAALAAAAVLTAALWPVLAAVGDPAPFADGATTATSLVAQLMLDRKWLGTWLVWVVTDVALVVLFTSQGLLATALLYAGFTVLCVLGWRRWRRELVADDVPAVPVVAR